MIQHILKQLWNKRRSNGWILVELILVTFFLWKAIDPIFVLMSNRAIDKGFDMNNTFCLTLGEYPASHAKYSADQATDSMQKVNFLRIYDQVRNYENVTAAVVTFNRGYPSSDSYTGTQFAFDSINHSIQYFEFYSDGEYFKVFGVDDKIEGNSDHKSLTERSVYFTKDAMQKIFDGENGLNQQVKSGDRSVKYRIAGIVDKFKSSSLQQPQALGFLPVNELEFWGFPYCMQICFRVREDVSPQIFMERFKEEFAPRISQGNYYYLNILSMEQIEKDTEFLYGFTNTVRLQVSLAVFFLLCTFLGISGTFWLRANSRRGEIGLRMALGSTRKQILRNFLTETWLLTTIAWFIGIFIMFMFIYHTGFAMGEYLTDNMEYIQNRPVPHFLIISLVVYILIVAIALLGTWIPANRAAGTEPAEALHDE